MHVKITHAKNCKYTCKANKILYSPSSKAETLPEQFPGQSKVILPLQLLSEKPLMYRGIWRRQTFCIIIFSHNPEKLIHSIINPFFGSCPISVGCIVVMQISISANLETHRMPLSVWFCLLNFPVLRPTTSYGITHHSRSVVITFASR